MRLCVPSIDDREMAEIAEVLASGYLTQGAKVQQFEQLVRDVVGTRHAFATSSGTTALHLSLAALGIGPGDEVLVADFTFPASANVVVQLGAVPVLVDVDPVTFTMDPADLARRVTPRSKAIMPVHTFGCSANMEAIAEVAERHGLAIVEDAACALGATCGEKACGSLGATGCFSFHPRKIITTGEGGMITTNDDALAEQIALLRSHGGVRQKYWFRYEAAGFNYRLSDVLGAIGVAQMAKLPDLVARRRTRADLLRTRLQEIADVRCPADPPWGTHTYQSFVVMVGESLDRDRLIDDLRSQDIETTLGTYALHDQPFFQEAYGYVAGQLPQSHAAFCRTVTLPLYPQMSEADLDTLTDALKNAIERQGT
jgi:perosamine synthetase